MKNIKAIIYLFLLLTLIACNQNAEEDSNQTNKIVTSIYPIEYIVSEIAGDFVEVETVVPSGADSHSYEPSTKRMLELADSDGFFFIGEGMEVFSETMAETVQSEGVQTLRLAEHHDLFEDAAHDHEGDDEHHHGDFDPHFWLDPIRMIDAGEIVLDEMVSLYPEQEGQFQEHFNQFKEKMTDLDEQFKSNLDQVNLLVAHQSFTYWEQRYPIKQYAIRGISSSEEPSQKELQELFEDIEQLNMNDIVLENNSDDRLALTIANELNLEKYYLSNLSTRTDNQVEENMDYVDIMLENLEVLKQLNQ
ncbi:metal ABC transporter solute-binding protein, Zn/Mn family [Tenuibacillus multivorans]|uniref:Zinc transport system substrate-binding protein n=1 Tax=Tenuibacillus multivorans TaxID=237069 RepID=A0A1H0DBW1_9BACI|nr:zinc ABC transporter substrate-binding protein [Tenuibacillus multivorans]GEL76622.1 adhesin [Tenuibacillus multivorans]SDN67461.1 zinc transport system substrate-binding protein [Tenuibacillus multivorans]